MKRTLNIASLIVLGSIVLTKQNLCEHLDGNHFGQIWKLNGGERLEAEAQSSRMVGEKVNDSIYQWDDHTPGWRATSSPPVLKTSSFVGTRLEDGVQIDWQLLTNIQYKLEYFPSLETEMYTPIFGPKLEELDGKEVQLAGYVIPFDPSGRLVALSANPMASCFFCGKASPASIMSLHLKDQNGEYQIDDFFTFIGTLQLNYDDPNEYYYILKDARPMADP